MESTDNKHNPLLIISILEKLYPGRLNVPKTVQNIPRDRYVVYILAHAGKTIVLGHGKYNRAKVIFDGPEQITSGHIKAIFVRCHHLFGKGLFERFVIPCADKAEAKAIEAILHKSVGGNSRKLPPDICAALFSGVPARSSAEMVLKMALVSSFDGLGDLKLWRRAGILPDEVWSCVGEKLELADPLK